MSRNSRFPSIRPRTCATILIAGVLLLAGPAMAAVCGNNVVEAGEACDDGNTLPATAARRCASSSRSARCAGAPSGTATSQDTCTGGSGTCPADVVAAVDGRLPLRGRHLRPGRDVHRHQRRVSRERVQADLHRVPRRRLARATSSNVHRRQRHVSGQCVPALDVRLPLGGWHLRPGRDVHRLVGAVSVRWQEDERVPRTDRRVRRARGRERREQRLPARHRASARDAVCRGAAGAVRRRRDL